MRKVKDSHLAEMFSGNYNLEIDQDNFVFVNRNPKVFGYVLDYLRNDCKPINFDDKATKQLFNLELKHWKLDSK